MRMCGRARRRIRTAARDRPAPSGTLAPGSLDERLSVAELELADSGVLRLPESHDRERRAFNRGGRINRATVLAALDADRDE